MLRMVGAKNINGLVTGEGLGRFTYTVREGEVYRVHQVSPCGRVALVTGTKGGKQIVPMEHLTEYRAGCLNCEDCGHCDLTEEEARRQEMERQERAEYRARRRF